MRLSLHEQERLMVSLAAYTLIYVYFMSARISLELARQERSWATT